MSWNPKRDTFNGAHLHWNDRVLNERTNEWQPMWKTTQWHPTLQIVFLKRFFMLFYLQLETSSRFIWIFVNYKVNLEWFFLLKLDAKRRQCWRKKVIREYDERTWKENTMKNWEKKRQKIENEGTKKYVRCVVCVAHIIVMCVLMKL